VADTTIQAIIEETEQLLNTWKHPDPYRPPTAPGGSKYERNLPVHNFERECSYKKLYKKRVLTCATSTTTHALVM